MGKNISFTKEQQYIINKVANEPTLQKLFYFTGGTALSYLYLHHRLSEDLDFFSETKFDKDGLLHLINQWADEDNFTFTPQWKEVVYIFLLDFPNGSQLKVDFGYYPYRRVEKGKLYEGIPVDSLLDIAINKLTAIMQRTAAKDFVDLYYLLQQFTIWDLMEGVRVKFHIKTEPVLLASDFLKVNDFNELPQMLQPLTLEELQAFFRGKAKELASQAVE